MGSESHGDAGLSRCLIWIRARFRPWWRSRRRSAGCATCPAGDWRPDLTARPAGEAEADLPGRRRLPPQTWPPGAEDHAHPAPVSMLQNCPFCIRQMGTTRCRRGAPIGGYEGPGRRESRPLLRVLDTSWVREGDPEMIGRAGYGLGSDRGSPSQGSTLASKRVRPQTWAPARVST
jgi:hypothetical protein